MPRRASSSFHPAWFGAALLLLLAAGAGGWGLYQTVRDPFRTLTPLDVGVYLENANSLRGNVYKVRGTVATSLAWSPQSGRLFSVETDAGKKDVVPVVIPSQFNHLNVQQGQSYFFKVEVGDKGVLRVQEMRKV